MEFGWYKKDVPNAQRSSDFDKVMVETYDDRVSFLIALYVFYILFVTK